MKVFYFFILFASLSQISCLSDGNDNQARELLILNKEWEFTLDSLGIGIEQKWHVHGIDPLLNINVPHTWNVDNVYQNYYGIAWYQKDFVIPANWKGKNIILEFERVYHTSKIWINGQKVGEHAGAGYTTFVFNISDYVKHGENNTLSVYVDNRPSDESIPYMNSFDWAMDGGIIGEVKLIATGNPGIKNVFVHSSYYDNGNNFSGEAILEILLNESQNIASDDLKFNITIREENQSSSDIVFEQTLDATQGDEKWILKTRIPSVNLWHFDHPNLYQLEIKSIYKKSITDKYTTTFGFRKFEIKKNQLFLNDEQVRLAGVEWMPGSDPRYGFAEPDKYISRVLHNMKDANCIFTRFHWQQSDKVIDLCNRLGILVQEEIPLWQQPEDFSTPPLSNLARQHAHEMISQHFNAPSIIAWGIGNELSSLNKITITSLLDLKEYVESLDSTRVVSYVSNHIGKDPSEDVSQYFDWIMMNDYYGTWFPGGNLAIGPVLDEIHKLFPEKPVIISEWGLCEECNPDYDQGGGDQRRITDMHEHYAQYRSRPWVNGFIYFSYNDYRTHMGVHQTGRFRQRIHGVVKLNLQPKPSWNHLKKISAPLEFIQQKQENNNVTITLRNKSTLPFYTIKNYKVEVVGLEDNQIIINRQLETILPGNRVNIEIPDMKEGLYKLSVFRPTGFHVIDHEFEINN